MITDLPLVSHMITGPHAQGMHDLVLAMATYGPLRMTNILYKAKLLNITHFLTMHSLQSDSSVQQATVLVDYIKTNILLNQDLFDHFKKLLKQDRAMKRIYDIVIKLGKLYD